MKTNWGRLVLAALVAYVAGFASFLLLFGNPLSQRLIYSLDYGQSSKLIDIWKTIEPIPPVSPFWDRLTSIDPKAIPVVVLLYVWALGFTYVYSRIKDSISGNGWRKGIKLGLIVWVSTFLFFEIFTPLNLFGEPLHLIGYELALELVISAVIGVTIVKLYEPGP